MSEQSETVRVNFGKPIPIFPLGSVTLLPHAVLPLHIFEPRYRQMVEDVLDGAGQIAMAAVDADAWCADGSAQPPVKPAVCVGQVVQHEQLMDGRYNILLQGVCRARITSEQNPEGDRMYRQAVLRPIEQTPADDDAIDAARDRIRFLLSESPLRALTAAENVVDCLGQPEAPTEAVLELIGVSIINDDAVRYRLLEEGDPQVRAEIIEAELHTLEDLLRRAEKQRDPAAPKGVTWN